MRSLYPPLKVSHQQTSSYFKKKKLIRIKTEIATDSIDLPKIVQSTKQTNNYSNYDLKNTPLGAKKKNLGDSDDFFKRILEMPNRKKQHYYQVYTFQPFQQMIMKKDLVKKV